MKTKRCSGCGAIIHAYRQVCPHCKKDMRPLYYKHPILTGLVIANMIIFMAFLVTSVQKVVFFTSSDNTTASDSGSLHNTKQKGIVAGLFSGKDTQQKLSPYELIKEEDSSIPGCSRKIYKIIIDNRVPRTDIESILVNLYEKKKHISDKVFIYAYAEKDADTIDKAKYKARLFMEASCDRGNAYAIDYTF